MRQVLILLLALCASSLAFTACDLGVGAAELTLQGELAYVNGNQSLFSKPGVGYQEILAELNQPADADTPVSYTAISLTASDLPLRAMTVTLVPAQTLGNGAKVAASATVRITDLNSTIDSSFAPKNAIYHLDASSGFGEENYTIPSGPGYLTVNWRTGDLTPLGPDKTLTDFILQQDKIVGVALVARKY
jgi:hypothetical protein